MIKHGGPRPATRPDDKRHANSGGRRENAGRKGYTVSCTLGEQTFIFDVRLRGEAEAVKRFAEMLGYSATVEQAGKAIIV